MSTLSGDELVEPDGRLGKLGDRVVSLAVSLSNGLSNGLSNRTVASASSATGLDKLGDRVVSLAVSLSNG